MKISVRDIQEEIRQMEEYKRAIDLAFMSGGNKCPYPIFHLVCNREIESNNLFFNKNGQIQLMNEVVDGQGRTKTD